MKIKINDLPQVIFYIIREYLIIKHFTTSLKEYQENCLSWRNFLSVSKHSSWKELKILMGYYNLNSIYSRQYLDLSRRVGLKARLKARITDPSLQVGLFLQNWNPNLYEVSLVYFVYLHLGATINSISLPHARRIELCSILGDSPASVPDCLSFISHRTSFLPSNFSTLQEVFISNCFTPHNLPSNIVLVPKITLLDCPSVTDLSVFREKADICRTVYLDLSFCSKLSDVSAISNIDTVILDACTNITDISSLNNVRRLSICGNIVLELGLSPDHKVQELYCSFYENSIPFLSSESFFRVPKICCQAAFSKISRVYRVVPLPMSGYPVKETNIQSLFYASDIKEVRISNMDTIYNIIFPVSPGYSSLRFLYLFDLLNLEKLSFDNAPKLLRKLMIRNCPHLSQITLIDPIEKVRISDCEDLKMIHVGNKLKELILSRCTQLQSIYLFQGIPESFYQDSLTHGVLCEFLMGTQNLKL